MHCGILRSSLKGVAESILCAHAQELRRMKNAGTAEEVMRARTPDSSPRGFLC